MYIIHYIYEYFVKSRVDFKAKSDKNFVHFD